jgi:predicted porin
MIGGLFKSASRVALVAAAGLLVGGVSAQAADLGGNCCADLEERVAELEATTARKGNRKVSLTVYGQVNESIMWWDDGHESNVYIGTNENSRTRFGFRGDAKISADVTAGYLLEIGVRVTNTGAYNQNADDVGNGLDIRHSYWYLDSKSMGRLSLGHTSSATDGITEINLSNGAIIANNDPKNWIGGFFVRPSGLTGIGGQSAVTWGGIMSATANAGEGGRFNVIKYTSPTFAGFSLQAAWGEDDMWDAALRYAGEFNSIRIAAGIGYQQWTDTDFGCGNASTGVSGPRESTEDTPVSWIEGRPGAGRSGAASANDCNAIGLSGSIMHTPTGLYAMGAWGRVQDDSRRDAFSRDRAYVINGGTPTGGGGVGGTIGILVPVTLDPAALAQIGDEDSHWYVQGGIERKWWALGKTTLYGEYFHADTGGAVSGGRGVFLADTDALNPAPTGAGNVGVIASSEVNVWGFGIVQNVEAAAMDLYLGYRNYSGSATVLFNDRGTTGEEDNPTATITGQSRRKIDLEDVHAVMGGAIIRF